MVSQSIRQALVLATAEVDGRPAATASTGGVPHIVRILLTLRRRDVRRVVVVAAGQAAARALSALVAADERLAGLQVEVLAAPAGAGRAAAIRRARGRLRGTMFLVDAERVFSLDVLDALLVAPSDGITLAVAEAGNDRVDGPLLPFAVYGERLAPLAQARGRALAAAYRFAGVCTCDDTLFDVLDHVTGAGTPASSDAAWRRAVAHLARAGCARVALLPPRAFSVLLSDRASVRRAEDRLLDSLRKPEVDGPIARHLNRHVSLALTRRLMHLPIHPNVVTAFNLLVALSAGLVASMATPEAPYLLGAGAVLWQVASMLDGTDGELARLKFQTSKAGEWFDTIVDDLGRVAFFLGVGYGTARAMGAPLYLYLMLVTVAIQLGINAAAYRKLLSLGAGSHLALAWTEDREDGGPKGPVARFFARIEFMARRDYYIFMFMLFTLAGFVKAAIVGTFLTTVIILGHDLLRPRKARHREVLRPILLRDE